MWFLLPIFENENLSLFFSCLPSPPYVVVRVRDSGQDYNIILVCYIHVAKICYNSNSNPMHAGNIVTLLSRQIIALPFFFFFAFLSITQTSRINIYTHTDVYTYPQPTEFLCENVSCIIFVEGTFGFRVLYMCDGVLGVAGEFFCVSTPLYFSPVPLR